MKARRGRFNLEEIYRRLSKGRLSDGDKKFFGSLAQEFKESHFYPLFLAVTARERELIELNRQVMESGRPDFVLGMIHENAVIENAIETLIEEKEKLLQAGRHGGGQKAPEVDEEIGLAAYHDRYGKEI